MTENHWFVGSIVLLVISLGLLIGAGVNLQGTNSNKKGGYIAGVVITSIAAIGCFFGQFIGVPTEISIAASLLHIAICGFVINKTQ